MQIALAGNSKQRFLFQEFSSVLSRSMPNRPTSAEGGGVSAINNVFNGALRRFSTVIPNNHGLPVSQAKCLNSIQSPNAATKAKPPNNWVWFLLPAGLSSLIQNPTTCLLWVKPITWIMQQQTLKQSHLGGMY
uniref:Uncharacterized protein n=1 Tax=Oryza rufipogon TaxID=4529 RepID=A0A0E0PRU4_ORYRU